MGCQRTGFLRFGTTTLPVILMAGAVLLYGTTCMFMVPFALTWTVLTHISKAYEREEIHRNYEP